MVVPVGGGPRIAPGMMDAPEVQSHLTKLKWLVVGLWLGGIAETLLYPMQAVSTVLLAIYGTYLFKDDRHLGCCYRALEQTPIQYCCQNRQTLQLLVPFCFFSAMNSFFDLFLIASLFSKFGIAASMKIPVIQAVVWVYFCETAAAYFSLKAMGLLLPQQPDQFQEPLLGGPGFQQPPLGMPPRQQLLPGPLPGGGAPAQSRMGGSAAFGGGQNYTAFQGVGRKLGG